jgi:hypothetical protein
MMRFACALGMFLLLAACASQPPAPSPSLITQCTDPRPQVCTMEYAPVCAVLSAGGSREYASACNACADDKVTGYAGGACPE